MAVAYRSSSFAANTAATDATSVVVTKPSGTVNGDGMLAIAAGYQSVGTTITAPAGWTAATSETDSSTGLTVVLYTKTAASEGANYTFNWAGGGGSISVVIITCSGVPADWQSFYGVSCTNSTTADPSASNTYSVGTNAGGLVFTGLAFWRNGTNSATGGASWTEIQDFVRQDGAPGTNWRGQSVYRLTSGAVTASGVTTPSNSIDLANAPSGSVKWTLHFPDTVQASGASAHTGATSSGTGTAVSNPTGSGASAHSGVTGAGTGQQWVMVSGGSQLSGVVDSGQGGMIAKGSGASALDGVQSLGSAGVAGTKFEVKINGVWTDVTPKLRHDEGVTITRGKSSSGSKTVTTTCSFRLDNRGHEFNPFNITGPYYGALNRNTEIRMTKQEVGVRFWGEIASFDFGTDRSGNDLWVDVECGGLLRRLEQGEAPAASCIRRDLLGAADGVTQLEQYWPMEETDGRKFANVVQPLNRAHGRGSRPPLSISQTGEGYVQFAAYSAIAASLPISQIGRSIFKTQSMNGNLNDNTGVHFLFASPSGMTVGTKVIRVSAEDTNGRALTFGLEYSATNEWTLTVDGFDGGGTPYAYANPAASTVVGKAGAHIWMYFDNGDAYLYSQGLDDPVGTLVTSMAAVVNDTTDYSITINPLGAALNEASSAYIGHLAVTDSSFSWSSLNAFDGEMAHTRFARLCTEEDINADTFGTTSKRMGPQQPGTLTQLLRECEDTDGGIMFELRDAFGLGYRCLSTMYNQNAALELDYEGGHLLGEFKPSYDDQDVTNDVTITRAGGITARYEITDGRMSTAISPDGIGRYESSATMSLWRDENAYQQAGWRAWKSSIDEVKVSRLATGLEVPEVRADGVLTNQALTVDLGDRLTVDHVPSWLGVRDSQLDQILDGYTERWDPTEHRWTYNTSAARPYAVARAKPTLSAGLRVGLQPDSFLNTAVGTGATTLDVITTVDGNDDQDLLKLTTTDEPFDIDVGGERMTVTNVADAGDFGVSFTGHRWTLTVTRSVNGVVKAHPVDSIPRLWDRPIVAL